MKVILGTILLLFVGFATCSTCTGGVCEAISQGEKGTILRADDGDVFIPINPSGQTYNCSNHTAICIGTNCNACKCKINQATWKDSHDSCKNVNDGYYSFSRENLEIDTRVTTVYFVLNSNNKYELRSTATGTSLPIVKSSNGDDFPDNCEVYKLYVMTRNGLVEIEKDGFSLITSSDRRHVEITPSELKIQPRHFQGKLFQLKFMCGNKKNRFLYFKVQGKSTSIDNTCLNCQGNFKYMEYLDIPEFEIPTTSDSTLHSSQNTLQMSGSDVSGCNEDSSNMNYYLNESDTCSLLQLPNTNLIYATQNRVQGRNLDPQVQTNAVQWEYITNKVINITVNCQGNKQFCVLFKLTNSSSSCSSGNPCLNGGVWTDKGVGSCVCVCPNGYSGELCTTFTDHCASTPCCGEATCSNDVSTYQCTCPPGKTGPTCCDNIDYCESSPCCNGATCTSNSSLLTYQCTCPSGKTGLTCCDNIDYCESSPCCNGATCSNNGLTHHCTCPPGKTGPTCCNDIDYCESSPCCDGATCTSNSSLLSHQCTCPPGKTGPTCCDNIDYCESSPCCNGATCSNNGLTHHCTCSPGKTGPTCCDDIDYCESSPCCNGATCSSNGLTHQCTCPPGKTGPTCCNDIDYCESSPCCNGATCSNNGLTYHCTCPPGKTGPTCCDNIDYCESSPCCNGATCTSNSSLISHQCTCPPGKTGPTCCNDIEYCSTDTCCANGRCVIEDFSAKCFCSAGYTGDRCCDKTDEGEKCNSDTCANGGTCIEIEGQVSCSCTSQYGGPRCSIIITEVPSGEEAGINRDDGEPFPLVPVVAGVVIGIAALIAAVVLTVLFIQRVYLPWRNRAHVRNAKVIDPFKDAGAHQIYNPMYVDEDAAIYSDKSITMTSSASSSAEGTTPPDIKQLDNPLYHSNEGKEFDNPLYNSEPEIEHHIYEMCTSTSLGSPQVSSLPGFTLQNPYDSLESSKAFVLQNPYDTLESSVELDQMSNYRNSAATEGDYSTIDDPVYESVGNGIELDSEEDN